MKRLIMSIAMVAVGNLIASTVPSIISSRVRENDPTILDVVYKVTSDQPTVKVRALAFEDGTRSFWKVIRPETFVNDTEGNPTAANIGDSIAPNVEHKLAWKVSSDWNAELAKVKFEILVSDMAQLPLRKTVVPAVGKYPEMTVYSGSQTAANVFNALLWHYADKASDLQIDEGFLYYVNGSLMQSRTLLSNRDAVPSDKLMSIFYCYDKMNLEPLAGPLCSFVRDCMRETVWFNSSVQTAILKGTAVGSLYVGEKTYWSVDLTTGEQTYLEAVPLAGWGDEYKTTKMLFRRIEPGLVTLGGTKPVTLTKPFYMGVFEVTQKQYELIIGSNPSSSYCMGDMLPVYNVSYDDIRGTVKGAQWPSGTEVDESSFLGKLKTKVGIDFDLPTESQWEYACRAGTTSYFNNGASNEGDLKLLGRFSGNTGDGRGGHMFTVVGSYLPNAWGLYDMHGNLSEWCLDWYGSLDSDPATDYAGAVSGSRLRILRGGDDNDSRSSTYCRSSYRNKEDPWDGSSSIASGFRLLRVIAQ